MDELAREYTIAFFGRTLLMHGDRPEGMRWTAAGQTARYEALLGICDSLEGRSVLDYGCGKGDFLAFLLGRGIVTDYTGIDINPAVIDLARRKFPQCRFEVSDGGADGIRDFFDYIILCGVFNLKVQGLDDLIRRTLRLLFSRCRRGLVFNALSAHAPCKDYELHYVSPEELSEFALRELSPFVALRPGAATHDFNLFVYREAQSSSGCSTR